MIGPIRHRGPDDQGFWTDESGFVGLAHARLSIVDLGPSGHQPMHSSCGRFVLCFNGEVYNHKSLRRDLDRVLSNRLWVGQSDAETLLAAIEHWGLEKALDKANGMFALALWDKKIEDYLWPVIV